MRSLGERFAHEAERLVGGPYRLLGRDPATGLDCAGLALVALSRCGRRIADRNGYSIRVPDFSELFELAQRCGFEAASGPAEVGDVLLFKPGPAQAHIVIVGPAHRFIHAHASIRRIVSQGSLPDWPQLAHWRLSLEPE